MNIQHREYVNPAGGLKIVSHFKPYACDKYAASRLKQLFRGNETQEDNDTSVQSQHPLVGESGNEGGSMRTIVG